MQFAEPIWLFVGLAVSVSLALYFHFSRKKREDALAQFASHHLVVQLTRKVSGRKRVYKNILVISAIFLCFVAFARPQYGYKWIEVKRKGIDLLFALDTSKSMLAEDIKPNRIKRAHLAILDFVQQLEGDRVGLLPFAGSAYLMCPLTMDYDAFEQSLSAVNTNLIPKGGTNIAEVIRKAREVLNNGANHKILIILTDGENLQGNAVEAAEDGAKEELTIYTVGVGTSAGELIPLGSKAGFLKDSSGNFVTSKLDQAALTEIAEKSGGLYVPLGNSGQGLETIYQQKLSLIPKEELAERRHKIPLERFEWPLGGALLLLLLEFIISERKNNGPPPLFSKLKGKFRSLSAGKLTVLLFLLLISSGRAHASQGEDAFEREEFLKAAEYYSTQLESDPENPSLHYNYGASSYKNNMYDEAIESFSKALKSDDIHLQEMAYFNMGNSHYQKGTETLQADPQKSVEQWSLAIESLTSAIELNPEDTNAAHNLDLIKKQLEELEKQIENQEQNQQDQNDQSEGQEQEGQQGDESGQQNSQGSEGKNGDSETANKTNPEQQATEGEQDTPSGDDDAAVPEENDTKEGAKAINETTEQEAKDQARQDTLRRQQGKMTKEEAERLLNALKNDEGELNFVPAGNRNQNNDVSRDW
jgi:Ca-activated chloride channel family protein